MHTATVLILTMAIGAISHPVVSPDAPVATAAIAPFWDRAVETTSDPIPSVRFWDSAKRNAQPQPVGTKAVEVAASELKPTYWD